VISSAPDPIDRAATLGQVDLVLDAIGVPDTSRARVQVIATRTPTAIEWQRFLASALLLLGAGLVLSGVISFFAFNWAALGRFAKMGLIAAGMTCCAVVALQRPNTLLSRVLLSAASVLLGALLAVFGQTYQTGADPWGLFATWAVLILPWAVAACFTPLWLLFVALVDTAHVLYLAQVRQGDHSELTLVLGLVAVHVLGVMAWEAQSLRREPWLRDQWGPRALLSTALALLLVPSLAIVISPDWNSPLGPVSVVSLTFLVVTTGLFYRLVRPDTFMLTAAAGTVMTLLTTAMGRLLIVRLNLGILGMFMMAGVVLLEVTLVVSWLRQRAREETA
jgi:uncharacterized membrane protein